MKDVFIIGGGPAGTKVAQELRILGFEGNITIFEDRFLGGECTNFGCIPSKTLYNFAKLKILCKKQANVNIEINPSTIINTVKRVVNTIRKGIEYNLKQYDIKVENKIAKVKNNRIVIDEKEYDFDVLVLSTGSSPLTLGYKDEKILTNRELWGNYFDDFINEVSKGIKVLIVGGGYIGLETASMLSTLFTNSNFTLIEKEKDIIFTADTDVINEIKKNFQKNNQNLTILTNTTIKNITKNSDNLIAEYESSEGIRKEEFNFIIMSIGRKINNPIENLKTLEFDEYLRLKNSENIWLAGDTTGGKMLAHKAEFQAKLVAHNIIQKELTKRFTKTNDLQIPSVMFSIPEAGWYGLTEKEVKETGIEYIVKKSFLSANARAIADNSREGFVKIIYNNRGEILGTHIVASNVSELINIPMVYNSETIVYPHPTLSEIFNELL